MVKLDIENVMNRWNSKLRNSIEQMLLSTKRLQDEHDVIVNMGH